MVVAPDPRVITDHCNDVEVFDFQISTSLSGSDGRLTLGRTGTITTPHGAIETPAFIPVGTKATLKALTPADLASTGSQAVLANAYHLYLQPGSELIDQMGGVGRFMGWEGPTFTDSGGFQVMSLGVGFKKVIAMDAKGVANDDVIAKGKDRLAHVDDDGVTFKSHLDGSMHRFTPEVSMQVQHQIGADIIFAFDECTTLMNTRAYQEQSVARTAEWARRCITEHQRLTEQRVNHPYQGLFGVIQGAQYEDLRRSAARDLGALDFDGFGIGGALEKENLGRIVSWVNQELPRDKPRHLLGIGEPDDLFVAIEQGVDTFDCVTPSRVARNASLFADDGRFNITSSVNRWNDNPVQPDCDCYTCANFTRAYLHHLFKAKEMLASTLATIHNVRFIVRLVDRIRDSISQGNFYEFRDGFLGQFYAARD